VDYDPVAKNDSTASLSASGIATSAATIASIALKGKGSLQRHSFALGIETPALQFSALVAGGLDATVWQGRLQQLDVKGPGPGYWQLAKPAAVTAKADSNGVSARLASACLTQKTASLCLDGAYQANSDFRGHLTATALPASLLNPYLPGDSRLQGRIDSDAEFERNQHRTTGGYQLSIPAGTKLVLGPSFNAKHYAFGDIVLRGELHNQLVSGDARLALNGNDHLSAQWLYDYQSNTLTDSRLKANISHWEAIRPLLPEVSQLSGELLADLSLSGKADDPLIAGTLDLTKASIALADKPLMLSDIELHASAAGNRKDGISVRGGLNPVFTAENKGGAALLWDGRVGIEAQLTQLHPTSAKVKFDLPAGSSLSYRSGETEAKLPLAAFSLLASVRADHIASELNLILANHDYLRSKITADTAGSKRLDGKLAASITDLSPAGALLADLSNVQGNLQADLALQGTLDKPAAIGRVRLSRAASHVERLGISLHDIDISLTSLDAFGRRIQVDGIASSGSGQIELDGIADLAGHADLTLQGQNFEVVKLPEVQADVNPALNIAYSENRVKIAGSLAIPKATVSLQEIPEQAVSVSDDEVILGQIETGKQPVEAQGLEANIAVELGKQVHFSGLGLDSNLSGRIKVTRLATTTMHGSIDMQKGRYRRYGQDLTLRKGQFVFNGPPDAPWLDIEAIRLSKSQDVTAILSLTGPVDAPKTRISSIPPMPETDALAYLITGSPLSQVGKSEGNAVAAAALSYGAGQMSWLSDKLGVDEFDVKQGKTLQDTLLAVGQHLTPDFYVGTQVGIFNRQATLVLKHNLTKNWNVETQAGTSQRVKLNYEIDTD
jgi:translocation and assembly module TamB